MTWKDDPTRLSALQKLPGLKGPALSIVVALMLAQSPLLAYELEAVTGYGNEAVTRGLRKLEVMQIAVKVSHSRGYMLTPEWRQLALPIRFEDPVLPDDPQKPDHLLVVSSRSTQEEDLPTNHQPAEYPQKPDIGGAENTVSAWLEYGGIAPGSPKMRLLVQKIQSPEYVKAHVLQHLHEVDEWRRNKNGGREPGTGTLIYRLEAGWPAPPMRCPDCLALEQSCRCNGQYIPPEYADIVQR